MRITNFHPHRFPPLLKRALAAILCVAFLMPNAAFACAWDRDTMAAEADGRMDTLNAIVGNFDIYPAQYYEMRIERVAKELAADPTKLELYDDIAVASDRVGRSTDAIEWMARKREQLDKLSAPNPEAEYRYLANLGTFHAHRWVGSGANRDDLTDLELGRDLIAAAIELNPDAHFGREKYQLMAIEWLIDPPPVVATGPIGERPEAMRIPAMMAFNRRPELTIEALEDARRGFTGLVSLGAGAESVDIMNTLAGILAEGGQNTLGAVAVWRFDELKQEGNRSLHPDARYAAHVVSNVGVSMTPDEMLPSMRKWYDQARAIAVTNQVTRRSHLKLMMARGEHPDTHPDIWQNAPPRKPLPELPGGEYVREGKIREQEAAARAPAQRVLTLADSFGPRLDVSPEPQAAASVEPLGILGPVGLLVFLFCVLTYLAIITGIRKGREEELAAATPTEAPPNAPSQERQ